MKPLLYIVLPTCLSIILLFSCQSKRENSLLLQNQGFKLWLIVNDKQNNDSIEWIQLGDFKIESFWKEYERGKGYSSDYSFDQLWFRNYISQTDGPRLFMKKGDVPEYLYFDSDGYACKLFFDRKAGNFFDRKNPVMTGLWKLKNDSILIINNNRFSFKQIDANPITLLVRDFKTGNTITIKDAFPDVSWHYAPWKDESKYYTHPDTLNIREVVKGRKERFIAINLPPKSKLNWEKSKKR